MRGAKLEDVLDSVPGLTPGDFVRSVKQLIDLLDQIAAAASYDAKGNATARATARSVPRRSCFPAPPDATAGTRCRRTARATGADRVPSREPAKRDRDVAATARAAIDAMRRGVIAVHHPGRLTPDRQRTARTVLRPVRLALEDRTGR